MYFIESNLDTKTDNTIDHVDTRSTRSYNRYMLTKTEIQNFLDKIDKLKYNMVYWFKTKFYQK